MSSSPITNAEETLVMALHELPALLAGAPSSGPGGYHATRSLPNGSISVLRSSNGALILQFNAVIYEPEQEKQSA